MEPIARDQDKPHVGCGRCHGVHQQRWTVCWEMATSSPGRIPKTPTPVFVHEDGRPWTSHYFRTHHLIPLLDIQRRQGDSFLAPYDGSKPSNSLADMFYSMHSYRRGARSHFAVKRPGCIRKARPEEMEEHGRWRRKRSNVHWQLHLTLYQLDDV
jgi:hypothetical protein